MNAITPAKLTPEENRMAASGILPIDPIKVKKAAIGPMMLCASTSRKGVPGVSDPT